MHTGERRQRDLIDLDARVPDGLELADQRVRGIDLVVTVGADQHQVPQVWAGQQVFEQVERRGVEPLQIVEKERKRMFHPRKCTDEAPAHEHETTLRQFWLEFRDGWRLTDYQLQFGDEVGHEPRIGLQRLQQGVAPARQLRVGLAEQRAHQALKRLHQRRIGNVALVLVELAGREEPPRRHKHLVQFIDDRGFSDAGIAGNQHQLRRAAFNDPIERGDQGVDLALPPIQLLGYQQPVRRVVFTQWEGIDAALTLPVGEAMLQIMLNTGGRLVALFGRLGEQLHDDAGDRSRDGLHQLARRHRLSGDMAVHPFHRVSSSKRQHARQHLVERDAERIEVAARIDRAIHPAGLLGCHVGERAGDRLGGPGRLPLTRQTRGKTESGEPRPPVGAVHKDMGRLEIFMDETALVKLA